MRNEATARREARVLRRRERHGEDGMREERAVTRQRRTTTTTTKNKQNIYQDMVRGGDEVVEGGAQRAGWCIRGWGRAAGRCGSKAV
jgi:hypothetical protein